MRLWKACINTWSNGKLASYREVVFCQNWYNGFFSFNAEGCIFNAQNGVNCIEFSEALPFWFYHGIEIIGLKGRAMMISFSFRLCVVKRYFVEIVSETSEPKLVKTFTKTYFTGTFDNRFCVFFKVDMSLI